jgi:DeoR/GlpR family transcriptional regulator of sugar metabolism
MTYATTRTMTAPERQEVLLEWLRQPGRGAVRTYMIAWETEIHIGRVRRDLKALERRGLARFDSESDRGEAT